MIVFATKLTVKKAAAGLLLLCAVGLSVGYLTPETEPEAIAATASATTPDLGMKIKGGEDCVKLLESCGWEVDPAPVSEQEVQIPESFDAAYQSYNELQQSQGLDLSAHKGKRATLYTFHVLNHPSGEEGVTANLVVRRKKLIAADVCSAQADGFLHGIMEQPK
ncbi:MAG: DUF4830 domain-containing protein [Clostridiaceae bacterium]|nr:DUF4830 domain-containing protein [Clostridiaceae bacterium]MCI9483001.1 DUF4830 domain-containing protein [Clostridiaceae bacterium]NBH78961.1 DUF4830 domain-containing protein [Clostridiaceae bacterium]